MKESASGTPRIKSRGGESVSFSEEPGVNLAVRKKKKKKSRRARQVYSIRTHIYSRLGRVVWQVYSSIYYYTAI